MTHMYANPYENWQEPLPKSLSAAGFNEKKFIAGNVSLNYVVGPNNGQPLVLIPAQMATWETYLPVLQPLAQHFEVYAIDVRGHGKSSWTPGDYSWEAIGRDMQHFLTECVQRPAIIAGNSSGGIIALWCAANLPEQTAAIILEDAPVFSVEMPRFKERDRFVYNGLKHTVDMVGDLEHRDLADYFKGQVLPLSETRVKRMPDWFVNVMSKQIKKETANHPGQPLELRAWYFPKVLRSLFKSLSMFDPDFARAFVDGRFYGDFSHEAALKVTTCPLLVLHADWHRYKNFGLVGAMDDDDAARIKQLAPHSQYKKIPANHVIHRFNPEAYTAAVLSFGLDASTSDAQPATPAP